MQEIYLISDLTDLIPSTYLYVIGSVLIIIGIGLFILSRSRKKPEKNVDLDFILTLFDRSNIVAVDYVRNKIVMDFKDVDLVDVKKLHEKGAKGVSIIGDRIKFYFDGGNERNIEIFNQIKQFIER